MTKVAPKEVVALGTVLAAVQQLDTVQQNWVFASAMSNLGLSGAPAPVRAATSAGANNAPTRARDVAVDGVSTPKQFLKEKSPRSDVQRIACLAYYLTRYRDQPRFKTKDLTNLNIDAAAGKIGNASRAVDNATKQSHYLAPAGAGQKQITAFGEDVVDALPDQDALRAIEKNRPKRRRNARRKGAKPKA